MSIGALILAVGGLFQPAAGAKTQPASFAWKSGQTILFVGDSNTAAGGFVQQIELFLLRRYPALNLKIINLGLPSEGVTGLSEPDHPFPRPNVHDRLHRALSLIKPNWVVACYGMNDGIYYPLAKDRLERYRTGMRELATLVKQHKARLILMTPPPFDALPVKDKCLPDGAPKYSWMTPYSGYNQVIAKYADEVRKLKSTAWKIVDLYAAGTQLLESRRKRDPAYRFAGDGVHFEADGHLLAAREILKATGISSQDLDRLLGDPARMAAPKEPVNPEVAKLMADRERLLWAAWLSFVGHSRPGMSPGLPMAEAEVKAGEIMVTAKHLLKKPAERKP